MAADVDARRLWNACLVYGVGFLLCCFPSAAHADGGALRLSERHGPYRVSVFTSPTPPRAGPVDVSVLVQDADSGETVSDVTVRVRAAPHGRPGAAIHADATTEAATNKLFRAAVCELPEPGAWDVQVDVDGPRGAAAVRLTVDVAEPPPRWRSLWPWVAWPALAVVLFAVHRALARHRARTHGRAGVTSEA